MKRIAVLAAVVFTMLATLFTVQAQPVQEAGGGSLSQLFRGSEGAGLLLWMAVVAGVAVIGLIVTILSKKKRSS